MKFGILSVRMQPVSVLAHDSKVLIRSRMVNTVEIYPIGVQEILYFSDATKNIGYESHLSAKSYLF